MTKNSAIGRIFGIRALSIKLSRSLEQKMKSKSVISIVLVTVAVLLLAACAPIGQTPAAATNPVPVTGSTPTAVATTFVPTSSSTASSTAIIPTAVPTSQTAASATSGPGPVTSGGLKYVLVPEKSEAQYAVREQLARLNFPSDAIGKTKSISGSVTLNSDGSIDSANSKITVDLTTLQTDSSMRDGFVSRSVLQTNKYPSAVFIPTQISGLPATIPQAGNIIFKVIGNMTIHGVTKPLTWDVTGSVNNGEATGTATTSFTFEDFGMTQPQVPVVLSVVDKITLTVNVVFQKS